VSVPPSLPSLRSLAAAPVQTRTYRHLLYLGLTFPLGVAYFVVLSVGLSLSASLIVLVIGLPLLVVTLLLVRGLAAVERLLANGLVDTDIAAPAYPFRTGSVPDRLRGLLLNRRTWIECGYLLSKFPAGVGIFVVLVTGLTTSLAFVATPVYYDTPGRRVGVFLADPVTVSPSLSVPWGDVLVGIEFAATVSQWAVDSLGEALAFSVLGVVLLVVTLNLVNLIAWLLRRYTRALLGDPTTALDRISGS
jgi:uncharacterized membrane protein